MSQRNLKARMRNEKRIICGVIIFFLLLIVAALMTASFLAEAYSQLGLLDW